MPDNAQTRRERSRQVVLKYIRGHEPSDSTSRQMLLEKYSELLPELADELAKLDHIESAIQSDGRDPPPDAEAVSTEVPNYELLRWIGQGSFGQVWLARNQVTRDYYAVKILGESCSLEVEGVKRYIEQVKTLSGLVPIHEVGKTQDGFYYVMPLADDVKGAAAIRSLDRYEPKSLQWCYKNQPPFLLDEVLQIGAQLLETLEDLHEAGLTHCDVKPANVLQVDRAWRLSDIGLMARTDQIPAGRGTLEFMPPERRCNHSADLYAVGKTLHLLFTGASVYRFDDFVAGELRVAHESPQVDRFREILGKACSADPESRYHAARDMRNDLGAVLSLPATAPRTARVSQTASNRAVKQKLAAAIAIAVALFVVALLAKDVFLPPQLSGPSRMPDRPDDRPAIAVENIPRSVSVSAAGILVARSQGNRVAVQNVTKGHDVFSTSMEKAGINEATTMRFSADASRLAVGGDGAVVILVSATGAQNGSLPQRDQVAALAWSPTAQIVAVRDRFVEIWDYAAGGDLERSDGQRNLPFQHQCTALAWSNGGVYLAAACSDGYVRMDNLSDRSRGFENINREKLSTPSSLAWRPDDKHLAVGLAGEIRIWKIALPPPQSGCLEEEVTYRDPSSGAVRGLCWSGDELIAVYDDHWRRWLVAEQGELLTAARLIQSQPLPDFPQ